jgi:hypothetical protein
MREDRREHIVLPAYHWAESKGVVPVFALSESIKTAASLRPFSVFLRAFDTNEPATCFERSITASGSAHIFVDRNFLRALVPFVRTSTTRLISDASPMHEKILFFNSELKAPQECLNFLERSKVLALPMLVCTAPLRRCSRRTLSHGRQR